MDHVPYPNNAAVPRLEIPYLCDEYEDYDCQGFLDYPVRRGWAESTETVQWTNCSSDHVAKRTQNWLFFGLLHEILGEGYHKELFLRQNPSAGGYTIDTTALPECLSRWTRSIPKLQTRDSASLRCPKTYFDHLDDIFVEVNHQSDQVDQIYSESRYVAFSVKVLLQSMQQAVSNVDYRVPPAMYFNTISPARITLLETNGDIWCPGGARDLCARHSVIMFKYIAALPRRIVNLNHRGCPLNKCTANNVNFATYKTQHVEDHCQCQFRGPDISKVTRLIREGSIPLVSIGFNPDGSPNFDVIKAEPGIQYTAISHVWIGGLGNFTSNELPQCQLKYLSDLVKELNKPRAGKLFPELRLFRESMPPLSQLFSPKRQVYRPPFKNPERSLRDQQGGFLGLFKQSRSRQMQRATFWMDTLLIPVGEENAQLRNKAIQSMSLIYARAKNVLVLDPELQSISLQDLPLEQASAHVRSSSWMTRCWTLQEACLSGNWVVQFKDGIFDPYVAKERAYAMREKAMKKSAWDDKVQLVQESISWCDTMPGMRGLSVFSRSQESEVANFVNTWNCLVERSTSKAEDLHVIFANMLDLPAGEVIKLQHDQRTKAIFSTQSALPLALIYNSSPKIDDPRNRWIPKNIEGSFMNAARGELKATEDGLIFSPEFTGQNYVGFLVPSSVPRFEKFRIQDPLDSELIWVSLNRDGADIEFEVPGSTETCYMMGFRDELTRAEKHDGGPEGARFAVMGREGRSLLLRWEYSFSHAGFRPRQFTDDATFVYDDDDFPMITGTRTAKDQEFRLECG